MNLKSAFQNNERAVSPVIGVILMVAITVILAAVIGTFVLGLGDSLGDSQPTAQLQFSADEGDAGEGTITIEHTGGGEIRLSEFEIQVRGGTTDASGTLSEEIDESQSTLGVGEEVTITYDSGAEEDADNIRLIHNPSDSIYADRTIVVGGFNGFDTGA